jgi:hypothetical protein
MILFFWKNLLPDTVLIIKAIFSTLPQHKGSPDFFWGANPKPLKYFIFGGRVYVFGNMYFINREGH